MKSKHTTGEWIAVGRWVEHVNDAVPDICNCDPGSMDQEGRCDAEIIANARLIAAAPNLLSALKKMLSTLQRTKAIPATTMQAEQQLSEIQAAVAIAKAAVAKAQGGAA